MNCAAVNQSEYSEIYGLPVAGIGMGGYVLFAVLALAIARERTGAAAALKRGDSRRLMNARRLLALTAAAGLAYSIYLTYVEIAIIGAVCLLCVISLALVTMITASAVGLLLLERDGRG